MERNKNNKVSPVLTDFENPRLQNKILNPNQQQLLEDTIKFRERMNQLRQGWWG